MYTETPTPNHAPAAWSSMITYNGGESLAKLANDQPVLLIFLRFFGCSFCREAISDISVIRKKLEAQGIRVVFVHMAEDANVAEKFFKKYKLYPVDHICDPQKIYYQVFGLKRGTPQQIFGLMNWIRGFQAAVIEGHGTQMQTEDMGDGLQMPGVFLLHKGEIIKSFVHQYPYDRPDYEDMCRING